MHAWTQVARTRVGGCACADEDMCRAFLLVVLENGATRTCFVRAVRFVLSRHPSSLTPSQVSCVVRAQEHTMATPARRRLAKDFVA